MYIVALLCSVVDVGFAVVVLGANGGTGPAQARFHEPANGPINQGQNRAVLVSPKGPQYGKVGGANTRSSASSDDRSGMHRNDGRRIPSVKRSI